MPVANLNAVQTTDLYTDSRTVIFPYQRAGFSANVLNAAIMYQLAIYGPAGREASWEALEHRLDPSLNSFNNVTHEGFPAGTYFAGIRIRSAVAGTPAVVTVL
jgi:hypothetical protein